MASTQLLQSVGVLSWLVLQGLDSLSWLSLLVHRGIPCMKLVYDKSFTQSAGIGRALAYSHQYKVLAVIKLNQADSMNSTNEGIALDCL